MKHICEKPQICFSILSAYDIITKGIKYYCNYSVQCIYYTVRDKTRWDKAKIHHCM